jgi:hypothetical protein
MYDFNNKNKIIKEDVRILLSYVPFISKTSKESKIYKGLELSSPEKR